MGSGLLSGMAGTFTAYIDSRRWSLTLSAYVTGTVFWIDQLSKHLVSRLLASSDHGPIELLPFFALRWEENRGISMSLLNAGDGTGRWLLVGITGLICAGVGLWLFREKRRDHAVALAVILGGALGNIADRITRGYVVDFLDLHIGEWRPFLIFNLADVAISLGVVFLLATSLLRPSSTSAT